MPAPSQPDSLREIQQAIAGTLQRRLAPGEKMQRSSAAVAEHFIKPNDRLTSFERLQIYNQQYWWRVTASFQEDFRGLLAVLGQRKFEKLATAYIEECGSMSWNLRDLGQALEGYILQHPELVAPHQQLALEMGQVEWARVIAFDGPEKPPLDPKRLGSDPEKLRLNLQPYITLVELNHPVDELLGRLKKRNIETGSASNAFSGTATRRRPLRLSSKAASEPIYLAIHRVDLSVYFKRLEPGAYRLLAALREGATLSDACGAAFGEEVPPNAAEKIQSWFAAWMRFGWLVNR